ncbi:MAG: transketolase [Pseudomonadota bacterium]
MTLADTLREKAKWVYQQTLQIHRIAPETRIASSLSCLEIFVALYYGHLLSFDSAQPFMPERDRCIISKGHGSISMYPILADLGYFDKKELDRVCQVGSFLGCIPDPKIPGYETINGSLGHGVGVGAGMALALKRKKANPKVFVVTGDGELQEGAIWEAFMFASHHKLDNLNVIVDNNHISMLGFTSEAISHGSLQERLTAFGWEYSEVNGHDVIAVHIAIKAMKEAANAKPKILIANTLKGHGIPFLENEKLSHIMAIKSEVLNQLLEKTI